MEPIRLRGARQNNLQGVDVDVFPGEVLVITGPSGAGKSSLALDTLYAEGQRRFVESFSPYARQFLDRTPRAELEQLEACPASIAVDRALPAKSGRSTVATRTEIADHVKLLFARGSTAVCPACGGAVHAQRPESLAEKLLDTHEGARAIIWMPVACEESVEGLLEVRELLLPRGFNRVLRGRELIELDEVKPSQLGELLRRGSLRVIVDRFVISEGAKGRLVEALEAALLHGIGTFGADVEGRTILETGRGWRCEDCGTSTPEPSPALFSFNNPLGACDACSGFGRSVEIDPEKVIDDPNLTIEQVPIKPFRGPKHRWERNELRRFCRRRRIPLDVPWARLDPSMREAIWRGEGQGSGDWFGIDAWFDWMESRSYKAHVRIQLARYRRYVPCETCGGSRFKAQSLGYRFAGLNIAELYHLPIEGALELLQPSLNHRDQALRILVGEIVDRLEFLRDVGVGYLSLERMSRSLSGGEAQRVGLATALGTSLSGTLFVIDEPTVGLHPADVPRLMDVVQRLSRSENAVVIVDNHPQVLQAADRVVDLGPRAGAQGGQVMYQGPPRGLEHVSESLTATLLAPRALNVRTLRAPQRWGLIRGASAHNLKNIDVRLPLDVFVAITGASGSGKSTLVDTVLVRGLRRLRGEVTDAPGSHEELVGFDEHRELVVMDQAPLGRTSRGNPATYVKAWDIIRARLARESNAVERGLTASDFSFNVEGGRCEACRGEGAEIIELQFLPDISLVCPVCGGRRFTERVLEVKLDGLTVAEILDLTVGEMLELRSQDKTLVKRLKPLAVVGLDYLRLGQPLSTLSDGEAQRLKLARAMTSSSAESLFIFDEPTVGLHPRDVTPLIEALHDLVERGCAVIAVTHDMQLAASADWLIDLGPGGGAAGGEVVDEGTPEQVAHAGKGPTAEMLAPVIEGAPAVVFSEPRDAEREKDTSSEERYIAVRGARQNNLKDLSTQVPRGAVTVVTGPSGSGKSSLTFDVIHAEGQRRYLQSLSPYVRQYLRQLPRPEVDSVSGVPPSIALEPRTSSAGGATVATLTEVGHHLRLLFARAGEQHCPDCRVPVRSRGESEVVEELARLEFSAKTEVLARVVEHRKGTYREVLDRARALGIEELRIDGKRYTSSRPPKLARYREHDIDFVIGSLGGSEDKRLIRAALHHGHGVLRLLGDGDERIVSTRRSCLNCGRGFAELDPTIFTHHSPHASCPSCQGRGWIDSVDEDLVFDVEKPLGRGGLRLFSIPAFKRFHGRRLRRIKSIPLDRSWKDLDEAQRRWLLDGRGKWTGLLDVLKKLSERKLSGVEGMLTRQRCKTCQGSKLAAEPRNVFLGGGDGTGRTIVDVMSMTVAGARGWLEELVLDQRESVFAEELRQNAVARLSFLQETGVGYLTLDRLAATLSGGETQRVRLAAQLGAGLRGVCYVLDEPTIGLHHRDTGRLITILKRLAGAGSTVLVVEHDEQVIRAADHLIDLGPGGGALGGRIVASGRPETIVEQESSPTGRSLARREKSSNPKWRPCVDVEAMTLTGVRARNLRHIDVHFPLKRFTAVSGVSGSGKSTLVRDVLHEAIRAQLGLKSMGGRSKFDSLEGAQTVARVVEVDQSPIGRTPRSVPATYLKIWSDIRKLFAHSPEARARGFGSERFSFNREGGRCEACAGQGAVNVEMSFLPNVRSRCEACGGTRFDASTREVTFRGKSIDQVLGSTVQEAIAHFEAFPKIISPLETLMDLGLGYLTLGQPSNTLSGGEAQRLKLATELRARARGHTVYILDEPTTGLHGEDVQRLIGVLQEFVERGHTVIVIEHHLDVIWAADHVIDLGPEGGDGGGAVVIEGTAREVRDHPSSRTGEALRLLESDAILP